MSYTNLSLTYEFPDTLLLELLKKKANSSPLPKNLTEKRQLLRKLMNVRKPGGLNPELLKLQNYELPGQREEKDMHLRKDRYFVEDNAWHKMADNKARHFLPRNPFSTNKS